MRYGDWGRLRRNSVGKLNEEKYKYKANWNKERFEKVKEGEEISGEIFD